MGDVVHTLSDVQQGTLKAVVIGRDGKVKRDLGTVAYYHRNPVIRLFRGLWTKFSSGRRIRRFNKEQHELSFE